MGSCGVSLSELTCLAHSMGGFLSLMSAAGDRGLFQRLVACSPMVRMKVRGNTAVISKGFDNKRIPSIRSILWSI